MGPPSPETTRPSVQHSAPLAAAGSEVERCIPGSRISMRHVGADSLPRSEAAVLGGPAGPGDQPGDPPLRPEGQTSASRPPLPCPAALGSSPPGQILSLRRAAPSSSPTTPRGAVWFCSTTCVAGKEPGAGAEVLAACSAGPSLWLAMAVNFFFLLQSLKNL